MLFGAGPILIGIIVLIGWLLDIPVIKSVEPGLTTMKANTALGLLAAGCGTLLVPATRRRSRARSLRVLLAACAGCVAVMLSCLTLAEYVSGLSFGLDLFLFADPHTTSPPYPGRMSPVSAASLACAGIAVLLFCGAASGRMQSRAMRSRLAKAAHLLGTVPAAVGYLGITGYAYRVEGLHNFLAFVGVALHTALGLLLLSTAILLTQARLGWGSVLISHPAAMDTFRRLLPPALLVPFLAGMLVVWGARARMYDPLYGPALFALAMAAASIGIAWIGAMVIRGAEDRLHESNARLAASEIALRAVNGSLEARVREEVAAREAAQSLLAHAQRMEALGQLAGGIAHDFNNVMQAIQGGAGLIRRRTTDPRAVDDIARMVEVSVQRGISVTRRLLSFARRNELRAERVDCAALLAELREVLVHGFGTAIAIRADIPADGSALALLADKGQLETVMVNLAANGRDAMAGGGTLTLSARLEAVTDDPSGASQAGTRFVRLAVCDTGEGMEPAVLARASEPFFTTKAPGQGTGLGLAMARSFAEQSGGRLEIISAPGQGTTVAMYLPGADMLAAEVTPMPEGCAPRPKGATVLVVDDEHLVREVLASGLADLGYTVLQAGDADAALSMLEAGAKVSVMLTDYAMPGTNGASLIKAARAVRPGLPAVLLTGNAGAAPGSIGEAGEVSLLRKPVKAEELADCIAGLLEVRRTDKAG